MRIDDQHNRPAGKARELCGGTGFAFRSGSVEQPHYAFAQDQIAGGPELGNETRQGRAPHRPDIEVKARLAACHGVIGRIDEIWSCLGGGNANATFSEMP